MASLIDKVIKRRKAYRYRINLPVEKTQAPINVLPAIYTNLPLSARASVLFSLIQIGSWGAAELANVSGKWPSNPYSPQAAIFLMGVAVFATFLLSNLALVVWEVLLAFRTKQIFWLQYGLAATVVALWVVWILDARANISAGLI